MSEPSVTECLCMQVELASGERVQVTSFDRAVRIAGAATPSGVVLDGEYSPLQGLDASSIVSNAGLAVGNAELRLLPDPTKPPTELTSGAWDGARFVIFRCDRANPPGTVEVVKRGSVGNVSAGRTLITVEFRALVQAYQQVIGIAMSKTCRNRFGVNDGKRSFCPVDLADHTETVEVTAVASRLVFTLDSAQPDDWSGNGILRFLDGDNAGQRRKVKSFIAGVVTLAEPSDAPILVGAMVEHQAGCRLRQLEDCRDKFDVVLDFNGEGYLTGIDHLTAPTEAPE